MMTWQVLTFAICFAGAGIIMAIGALACTCWNWLQTGDVYGRAKGRDRSVRVDEPAEPAQALCKHETIRALGHNLLGNVTCTDCGKVLRMDEAINLQLSRVEAALRLIRA